MSDSDLHRLTHWKCHAMTGNRRSGYVPARLRRRELDPCGWLFSPTTITTKTSLPYRLSELFALFGGPQNDDMYSEGIQIDERHRPIVRTNKGPLRIACAGSAFRTTWPESPSDASTVTPPSFKQAEEGKVGPRPEVPTRRTFPKFEPHTQPRGVPHGAHRRTRAGEMPHQLRSGKQKNQTGTPLAASRRPPAHTSATLAAPDPPQQRRSRKLN